MNERRKACYDTYDFKQKLNCFSGLVMTKDLEFLMMYALRLIYQSYVYICISNNTIFNCFMVNYNLNAFIYMHRLLDT